MASKALTCAASPLLVSNKASSGPSANGLGSNSLMIPSSSKGRSLVVKAQLESQGSGQLSNVNLPPPMKGDSWHNRTALLESPRYVRAPWRHSEGPEMVEVSFDMPGFLTENTKADITGDVLHLYGRENEGDNFVRIASYQLPGNCEKYKAVGVLKHGVLTIFVPKNLVDFVTPVPIKSG